MNMVPLGEFMPSRIPSVNPAKHPDEVFELWSIPAFDEGKPEVVPGSDIGSSKKCVEPGDVLLSRIVPHIRRSWVVSPMSENRQIASGEWITFRSDEFDGDYMRHMLTSDPFHIEFMKTVAGVGGSLLRARPEGVKQITIPLPPLEEQRRIAGILDQADALRRLRTRALDKLNTLGQAIFHEVFAEGIRDDTWLRVPLSEAVSEGTIVTYGIVQAGEEYPGGVPYIRTGDIQNGQIIEESLRHTDPAIAAKFERSKVRAGEIVMSIRATVGTCALVSNELDGANLTQGTARISPGSKTVGHFLLQYLRSAAVQAWIQRQVKGATFREITLGRLRELPVVLPPLDLQQKFAERVQASEKKLLTLKCSQDQFQVLFASLQHKAFRGEL